MLFQFCTLYYTTLQTMQLYISQEELTMLNKQLYQYASNHWASKQRFDRKQCAMVGKQVSRWPVCALIGSCVLHGLCEVLVRVFISSPQNLFLFIYDQLSAHSITAGESNRCLLFLSIFCAQKIIRVLIIQCVLLNVIGKIIILKPMNICFYSIICSIQFQMCSP